MASFMQRTIRGYHPHRNPTHADRSVPLTTLTLPTCEICGQPVDQSVSGSTVNSNKKHWHGFCYKTQARMDQYKAGWDECVLRLRGSDL